MTPFYVINWHPNAKDTYKMDIMGYLMDWWENSNERKFYKLNKTSHTDREVVSNFVKRECMSCFWSRCEYETIIMNWPSQSREEKIDVWDQIEMNFDVIVDLFMKNLYETLDCKR